MVNDKSQKSLPPYVSYRTFQNFIDVLQLGMPSRIDRSYWGERYSGSTGTQLMTALRFLGLVDSNGIPMTRLKQLVSTRGAQRSEILKQIAYTAFNFLSTRSLDPQVATYAQLEEVFYNTYQVTGEIVPPFFQCAACKVLAIDVIQGRELYLDRLEVEDDEHERDQGL